MISEKSALKKLSLEELVFGALSQLQKLQYHNRSIRRYQSTWRRLIKFSKEYGFKNELSQELIADFLEHYEIKPDLPAYAYHGWRKHAEFSLKMLWNYSRFGYFERCQMILKRLNVPPKMQRSLFDYKKYCEEKRHLSPFTVDECIRQIGFFLDFLGKRNVQSFDQIRAGDVSDFIYSLSRFSKKTISSVASYIRVFLKFLFFHGKLKKDLSKSVPSICVSKNDKIPSVWDHDQLTQLLEAVDRGSPRGKRDYAIFLLACRLGLRAGDIRDLTLDQIDWETETISIVQSKNEAAFDVTFNQ